METKDNCVKQGVQTKAKLLAQMLDRNEKKRYPIKPKSINLQRNAVLSANKNKIIGNKLKATNFTLFIKNSGIKKLRKIINTQTELAFLILMIRKVSKICLQLSLQNIGFPLKLDNDVPFPLKLV